MVSIIESRVLHTKHVSMGQSYSPPDTNRYIQYRSETMSHSLTHTTCSILTLCTPFVLIHFSITGHSNYNDRSSIYFQVNTPVSLAASILSIIMLLT